MPLASVSALSSSPILTNSILPGLCSALPPSQSATHIVGEIGGAVPSDCGLGLVPSTPYDCPPLDLIASLGEPGWSKLFSDRETIEFVRRQARAAKYVTSVCTGRIRLGVAGLLKGRRQRRIGLLPICCLWSGPRRRRPGSSRRQRDHCGCITWASFCVQCCRRSCGQTTAGKYSSARIRSGAALDDLAFSCVAPTRGNRSAKAQCVVARRPLSNPATPKTNAPVHTEVTYFAARAWRRTNSMVSRSLKASTTPRFPPGTQIKSRGGQFRKGVRRHEAEPAIAWHGRRRFRDNVSSRFEEGARAPAEAR